MESDAASKIGLSIFDAARTSDTCCLETLILASLTLLERRGAGSGGADGKKVV